jgi:hypothetical protein
MSISITSDAVEITKLVTTMFMALAWPVVVLVVALAFRTYIAEIIGRATGIEWGSFKVSFERKLENAEERATQIAEFAAIPNEWAEQLLPTDNLPPDYLILEAWRRVEATIVQLAERAEVSLNRGRSPLFLVRNLRSRGVIDGQTSALIDDLRALRNVAVHPEAGPPISREQAIRFRDLAELVINRLRGLP